MELDYKKYLVNSAPKSVYYIPNYVSEEEEMYLLNRVNSVPGSKWTNLSNRRLQNWGGTPSPKGMIPEKIPDWLQSYCDKISNSGCFGTKKANHVLVNEYTPGQGIMPHLDGDLYYPTVTTITLGSGGILDFYEQIHPENECRTWDERHVCSLLLEPRSLFISQDDMYNIYLHGIEERKKDVLTPKVRNVSEERYGEEVERATRVSLTIRNVPKVLRANLFGAKR